VWKQTVTVKKEDSDLGQKKHVGFDGNTLLSPVRDAFGEDREHGWAAAAATRGNAEAVAQFSHGTCALADLSPNLVIGYRIAKTDVHRPFPQFGIFIFNMNENDCQ
jgi:hypothetical protein